LVEVEAAEVKAEGLREEMPPALEVLQERQGIRMQEMEGQVVQVVQVATGGLTETEEQQEKRGLTGTIRPENQGLEEGEAEPQVITL
jgi:succinate dehydrogenase/fumarate reductase flavoprotein subunit